MQNIVVHEYHGYTDHFEEMFIGLVFTYVFTYDFHLHIILLFNLPFSAASISLTQTHPAAPYVCRTGNITLRCQYDGVEGVSAVMWVIGGQTTNPSTIPGHTVLPPTTTYQEIVVDSYTNLRERYQCTPVLVFGAVLNSNVYLPRIERT